MLTISKRNGTLIEKFDLNKLLNNLTATCANLKVSTSAILKIINQGIPDQLTSKDLNLMVARTMDDMKLIHPDYERASARYYLNHIYKETPSKFSEAMAQIYLVNNLVPEDIYDFIRSNATELDAMIDHGRDELFSYTSLILLENQGYLINLASTKPIDRPQFIYLRTAVALFGGFPDSIRGVKNKNKPVVSKDELGAIMLNIKKYYDLMSNHYYTHATPTLYNSCGSQQLGSCFLLQVKDSIEDIMDCLKRCSLISKRAGGLGIGFDAVRCALSLIKGTNGVSKGIPRMLSLFNAAAVCWDQGSKRKGAFAVYLETHHGDIEEFLKLRDNSTAYGTKDLNLGLWVSDLFIERVRARKQWTLFSSSTAEGLTDVYGDEYKKLYEKYETQGLGIKTMSAMDLLNKIAGSISSTSYPYVCFKDHTNRKSNQKNLGIIKCSNLCTEIMEYSTDTSVASCTLASICLKKFVILADANAQNTKDKQAHYDYAGLHALVKDIVVALDNVIKVNNYPIDECVHNAKNYRPIGIGVQGLADVFCLLRIPFISTEASAIDKRIFETIYHASLEASCELSQKLGAYEGFYGSPASVGILQYHMWYQDLKNESLPSDLYNDWDSVLIPKIKKYGLRNSLMVALMPTVSTSKLLNNNDSFEPFYSNINTVTSLSGSTISYNRYMVNHLIELGLWNNDLVNKIMLAEGSIQGITSIPQNVRDIYKTVFEIKQSDLITRMAIRSCFVDQSASLNIHSADNTPNAVKAIILKTHSVGLKTGIYYFRPKTSNRAIKNILAEPVVASTAVECTDEVCTMCSS